ncbi:hypothetical protein L914_07458 [Phytophthora nicotianae]|uniref:Uncharacterized protein n=3 Tax=Phytophthora nicotianae TaxID=4792 RepID=V9G0M0_PHYNI|nr:hypothetical protein F443_01196 [Phytophthora nicotianae P1569]ETM47953.1 hypothetical protein L914_07458 [Phytophthora nicotianae]ETO77004.1 hypothetical protein F444_07751 [Phytophthora nicotianae P1976]
MAERARPLHANERQNISNGGFAIKRILKQELMTTAQVFPTGYAQKCIARINE